MNTNTTTHIVIAIPTFRRYWTLVYLLLTLERQIFSRITPSVEIILVDNAAPSLLPARMERLRRLTRWPITYVEEARRGFSHVRNACLDHVSSESDWFIFLDDDVHPEPTTLETMILAAQNHSADAVWGPVLPRFITPPPAWMNRRIFHGFAGPALPQTTTSAATSNLLLRVSALKAFGQRFSPHLNECSGEDTLFCRQWRRRGFSIHWEPGAGSREWVPKSRATSGWIWRRSFRVGLASVLVCRELHSATFCVPYYLAYGLYHLLGGSLMLLITAPLGKQYQVRWIGIILNAFGMFVGVVKKTA